MDLLHKLPIRKKLTLIIFISNLMLLTLVFAVSMYWDTRVLKHSAVDQASSQIQVLSQDFTKILLLDSPVLAADTVSRLEVTRSIDNAFLYDKQGKVLFRYTRDPRLSMSAPPLKAAGHYFEGPYLHMFAPVVYEGTQYGTVYFRITNELLAKKLTDDMRTAGLFFIGGIGISFLIAYLFQNFFSGPIIGLGKLLNKVAVERDFQVRAATLEQNEIGEMYANFNRMIEEIRAYHHELSEKNHELERHRNHLEDLVEERTQELQLYTKELEAFSYSVSHDLRSPLRAIHGFSQIILEDHLAGMDETAKAYFVRICTACRRMSELIDDLLKLSQYTQHKLHMQLVDLSALAHDVVSMLKINFENGERTQVSITPNMLVQGDPKMLRIVLENLVSNAFKYSQYRTKPHIEIGCEHLDNDCSVYIKDNGIGFDAQFTNKLFLPFERLHNSEHYEGTGIGLAIVQRIVTRHGGKVWARSKEGQGATFYFSLAVPSFMIVPSKFAN